MYKQPHQDLDLCSYSFACYSKSFTQIYRALKGDARERELFNSQTLSNQSSFHLRGSHIGPPFRCHSTHKLCDSNLFSYIMRNPVGVQRCKKSSYWRVLHLVKIKYIYGDFYMKSTWKTAIGTGKNKTRTSAWWENQIGIYYHMLPDRPGHGHSWTEFYAFIVLSYLLTLCSIWLSLKDWELPNSRIWFELLNSRRIWIRYWKRSQR